jgi:hypothetical protein
MNNSDETKFDEELTRLAATLPTEVSPDRDLWPAIERAISAPAERATTIWNTPWAQAAALVLLVAGSSGITYVAVRDDAPVSSVVIDSTNIFATVSGDFGRKYTLGNEYLDAHSELQNELDEKLQFLSPEARDDVINNLDTIRAAIKDINQALAAEPDNILLQELLLSAYHGEISLMKKVDGIANSAMRRNDI